MQPKSQKRNKSITHIILPKNALAALAVIKSVALPSPAHRRRSDTPSATPRTSTNTSRASSYSGPSGTPTAASYRQCKTPSASAFSSRNSSVARPLGTPSSSAFSSRDSSISRPSDRESRRPSGALPEPVSPFSTPRMRTRSNSTPSRSRRGLEGYRIVPDEREVKERGRWRQQVEDLPAMVRC